MNTERHKLEIGGVGFVCFFLYASFVWLCDAFDLFCYLVGFSQVTLLSRCVITILLVFGVVFGKDRIKIRKGKRIDAVFCFGALVILGFCAYKGVIPDLQADVKNYHLFVQYPGFQSMTNGPSLMAGDFQYYGFRWADRLFYAFRKTLGYRMGTLLGGIVNVLLYAQMRDLLFALHGDNLREIRKRLKQTFKQSFIPGIFFSESVLAFAIVMTYDLLLQSGGYMIDCIGIPFILEAVYILFIKKEEKHASEMIWFALLCGCFFAIKMTHIVYVAPVILAYLIKHRKYLSCKRFAAAFCLAIIPVSIYLLYAYVDTGNPVFPYFNSIFESPYFNNIDFKDHRWGPQNIKELILWPLIHAVNPQYRVSEIPNEFKASSICLMFALLVRMVEYVINRKEKRCTELLFIAICSAYLWSCSTGHGRYYIFGYMLAGILVVDSVINSMINRNHVGTILFVMMLIPILVQPVITMKAVAKGYEWSWRNTTDKRRFAENLEYVFRDQRTFQIGMEEEIIPPEMILMSQVANGSIANSFYPSTPIVLYRYLKDRISDSSIQTYWDQQIDEALTRGNVYEIVGPNADGLNWDNYISILDNYRLKITDIKWPNTVFIGESTFGLFKLERLEDTEHNSMYNANEVTNRISVPNERILFSANVILSQCRGWESTQNTIVSLKAKDKVRTVELYSARISEKMTISINEVWDLSSFGEDVELVFEWCQENGDHINTEVYDCLMINPKYSVL